MRRRTRPWPPGQSDVGHSFFGGTGWLFADLMVALAMVFLVATALGFPTPSKSAAAHHPAPKKSPAVKHPEAALDFKYVTITIPNLDYNGLLNNSPAAINSVRKAILSDAGIRSRRAGLVLLFDGATSQDLSSQALAINVDRKLQDILRDLGTQNVLFQVAVYRNFLDLVKLTANNFHMEIYLFKTS
jgi:hypothetical protein